MTSRVADGEGALRRLDQPVDDARSCRRGSTPSRSNRPRMISDARPCVGGGVLKIVASASRSDSGLTSRASCLREVGTGHRAADLLEVGGDRRADVAAVEIVEAGMGELLERVGEPLLRPCARRPPAACRRPGNARRSPEPAASSSRCSAVIRACERLTTMPSLARRDRIGEKLAPRYATAERLRRSRAASAQPETAPATVSAASGPRAGTVS